MRRVTCIVFCALFVALGCGSPNRNRPETKLLRAITETEHLSRAFTYTDTTATTNVVVTGRVEDDLRYEAAVTIDGVEAVQGIVYDDALAVRFPSALSVPPIGGTVQTDLLAGRWVVDYQAAPPLQASRNERGTIDVGANPFLDTAYIFQYIRRAVAAGAAVIEFNPDSLTYFPKEDPFPKPEVDGPVQRYDVISQPLPRRAQRGSVDSQPGIANFRKLSIYVVAGKVQRIEEEISIRKQHDFLLSAQGKGTKFNQALLKAALEGKTREPVRERRMTYVITGPGSPVSVNLPADATAAEFGTTFGPRGLRGDRRGGTADPQPDGDNSQVQSDAVTPGPAS